MATAELEFDAGRHEYRVAGVLFPSVTAVLEPFGEDWGVVPASILDAAAAFGRHVHEACHLFNRGELDMAALDPALAPYVAQYQCFLEETGAVPIASELPVYHPVLKYAGTLDVVVEWRRRACLIDLKTAASVPRTAGPQTAAYEQAGVACGAFKARGQWRLDRYCLHLQPDRYKAIRLSQQTDWNIFQAALTLHHWKTRGKTQ